MSETSNTQNAEARTLSLLQQISDCASGRKHSTILHRDDCALIIRYVDLDKPIPKREVKPADVADKIVHMLNQTITDQDVLITHLLDIIKLLASRRT